MALARALTSAEPRALFVYGTLMLPHVVRALTGTSLAGGPARLRDHARYAVHGEVYPAVVARAGASTSGVLLEGVGPQALAILDRFEGPLYERVRTVIELDSGVRPAHVYVIARGERHRLSDRAWDPEAFARLHLHRYVDGCRRFRLASAVGGAAGFADTPFVRA
jgi:gamma-glutamylcyclotransferase (GGCT)/AIG2-like uncharacterized protein YtfP